MSDKETDAEKAVVTGPGVIVIIIGVIGLFVGLYVLWNWFLKENNDGLLLDKVANLMKNTMKLIVPGGALYLLKDRQNPDVTKLINDFVDENYPANSNNPEDKESRAAFQPGEQQQVVARPGGTVGPRKNVVIGLNADVGVGTQLSSSPKQLGQEPIKKFDGTARDNTDDDSEDEEPAAKAADDPAALTTDPITTSVTG